MIPVGLIVRAIEKLVSSSQDTSHAVTEMVRVQHVANLKGAAFRLGGTFEEHGRRTSVRVGGVLVELAFTVSNRALAEISWVVSSRFPIFRIERKRPFVRGPKVPRGTVPWLDDRFVICSRDIEGIRTLWTQELCQAAYRTAPTFSIKSDGFLLELRAAYPRDGFGLDNGIALMRSLAEVDVYAAALLKDLPHATYVHATLPYVTLGNTGTRIGYARIDELLVTEARLPLRTLAPDAESRLRALGASTLTSTDTETIVQWPAVIKERARLNELAEALRTIVTPIDGVFR